MSNEDVCVWKLKQVCVESVVADPKELLSNVKYRTDCGHNVDQSCAVPDVCTFCGKKVKEE
jgi:hypothetical protein